MDGIFQCIDEGAPFMQVDNAIVEMGYPMSPFTLAALVGPAIALHVQETLNKAWPDRFPVNAGLKNLVAKGKKSILTFTDKGIDVDPEIAAGWPQGNKKFTDDEIRERVLNVSPKRSTLSSKRVSWRAPKMWIPASSWERDGRSSWAVLPRTWIRKVFRKRSSGKDFHPNGFLAIEK